MSQTQLLKDKNLWPSKKEESWRYFDLNKFETFIKNSNFAANNLQIEYSSKLFSEVVINPDGVTVADDLKLKVECKYVDTLSVLNLKSNLDFRLTHLNLNSKRAVITIANQKDLNLKLTYKSDSNSEQNLNSALLIEFIDSKVSLLEQDQVQYGSYFSNHLQIRLDNSNLEHISLLANSGLSSRVLKDQAKIYNSEVLVGKNSTYKNTSLILNNKFIRTQQSVALESESAIGHLNAFSISEDQNFSELRTEVLHLQPKTESRQLFKSIAADSSKSVFNGRIYVEAVAQKTDAAQLCQGILLHPKAEISAKPELEIYADDVKASHGAAIGQMGQDQVFYLISRGIKPEVAYQMLSKAFAGEVLASITNMEFRKKCQTIMDSSSSAIFEKLAENITSSGLKR